MQRVTIKSSEEIELMREAGRRLGLVHQQIAGEIRAGMSTMDVNRIGEQLILDQGCIPSCKNYEGFPAAFCVSVNEEVVHGIPSDGRILAEGDIVSLDTVLSYKGYHADATRTIPVGKVSKAARLLIERTRESFFVGMRKAFAGRHLHEISRAIGDYAKGFGYGIVRDYCGHGIGADMHEDPEIPNYRQWRRGIKLKPGMTLAVEPMINMGTGNVVWAEGNDWTAMSADMSLSAHYENTVLITDGKPEILTITDDEREAGYLDLF
ncbi:MAG: type I methionyl aminopeptidase [Clostridiales bacterium]|nr:type I methionyl aminopeptidase [Clostridiales bacterium]